jgi:hypothetical protein
LVRANAIEQVRRSWKPPVEEHSQPTHNREYDRGVEKPEGTRRKK